jgi:hypothetical protein
MKVKRSSCWVYSFFLMAPVQQGWSIHADDDIQSPVVMNMEWPSILAAHQRYDRDVAGSNLTRIVDGSQIWQKLEDKVQADPNMEVPIRRKARY